MLPFQTVSCLRAENGNLVLYNDVYNKWIESLPSEFRKNPKPWSSVVQYIQSIENLALLFSSRSPQQLSFDTKLGARIAHIHKISEVLIDSTFKSNSERTELIVVVVSYFDVGFQFAYRPLGTSSNE